MSNIKDDKVGLLKRTLIHSKLPLYVFFNFSIREHEDTYLEDIPTRGNKDNNRLKQDSFDWNFDNQESKIINYDLSNTEATKGDLSDDDFDNLMLDIDNNIHDELYQEPLDNSHRITVHHSSISINNLDPIPLQYQVLSSNVIRAKNTGDEDTLILLLKNFDMILLRFNKSIATGEIEPYIVYSTSITGLALVDDQKDSFRLDCSNKQNILFLTTSQNQCLVYDISYNQRGIPYLEHSHNFETNEIIAQCFVPISISRDSFVYLELDDGVLTLQCIYDLHQYHKSKIFFKNTFDIPLHMIPLKESNAIIFLQEAGFSIKSLSFCIEGEELETVRENYKTMVTPFVVNSYHVPINQVDYFGNTDEFDKSNYKHDQILISATDFYVYVIDVFYHLKLHTFKTRMNRLFKYKAALSNFSFEKINLDGEYLFDISNEMGLTERKRAKIVDDQGIPKLEFIDDYWSEVNPYPIFDFEIIPQFDKYSIESCSKELWILSGAGSNHSIMNFKYGYVARSTEIEIELKDISIIGLHGFNRFWLGGERRLILTELNFDSELPFSINPIIEIELDGSVISSIFSPPFTKFITTNKFLLLTDSGIETCYTLPFNCILADCIDDITAMILKDNKTNTYCIQLEHQFELFDHTTTFSNNIKDLATITLLKFLKHENEIYLLLGTSDSKIYCYIFESELFLHRGIIEITLSDCQSLSSFIFIPYQAYLDSALNILVFTSLTGEYAIVKANLGDFFLSGFDVVTIEKIADTSSLGIIETRNGIYLNGQYLWKLDYTNCAYPKIVVMEDNRNRRIKNGISLNFDDGNLDHLLVLQNSNISMVHISREPSFLTRSKNFGIPCMKLTYVSELRIFAMIKFPGMNNSLPQLLFADPKSMKVMKAATDLDIIFKKAEIPLCLHEWKFYEGDKMCVLLAVGSTVSGGKSGSLSILKLARLGNDIHVKPLHSIPEEKPVTHATVFHVPVTHVSNLIYSTGYELVSYVYSTHEKKMRQRKVVFKGTEVIKKFILNLTEENLEIYVTYQNNTSIKIEFSDFHSFSIKKTVFSNDFCSDILTIDELTTVQNNFNNESITVIQGKAKTTFNAGYLPRLGKFDSYPPWISLKDRADRKYKQFITVGLGGEIDLMTITDESDVHGPATKSQGGPTVSTKYCPLKDYKPSGTPNMLSSNTIATSDASVKLQKALCSAML